MGPDEWMDENGRHSLSAWEMHQVVDDAKTASKNAPTRSLHWSSEEELFVPRSPGKSWDWTPLGYVLYLVAVLALVGCSVARKRQPTPARNAYSCQKVYPTLLRHRSAISIDKQ